MARISVSPGFVIGLTLLFINDYFLKQSFPGIISGKLSDVAGIFIVGLLATAVGGNRPRNLVVLGLLFLWWKSPLAGPAIAAWNAMGLYQAGRTIDYTDYLALIILPLAYRYERSCQTTTSRRPFVCIIALLSVIGIMGTSPARYDIYRDIIEPPEAPATVGAASTPFQRVEFLSALNDIAQARGLVPADFGEGADYRTYTGAKINLKAHYDRSRNKGYLRLYAKDPYRTPLKEQKSLLNAFWPLLERDLTDRGFTITIHDNKAWIREPVSRISLTIISPAKGMPLTSGYNGTGNEDIARAQRMIDDFFASKGFARAFRDLCYPAIREFSKETCRNYYRDRPLGADRDSRRDSRSTDVTVQGDMEWQGTVLTVTLQQHEMDAAVDVNGLARELKDILEKQFADRLSLSIRNLLEKR